MTAEARMRHTCILGQTGTGKSTLLESMVAQDIEAGKAFVSSTRMAIWSRESAYFMSNKLVDFFKQRQIENCALGLRDFLIQANLKIFAWDKDQKSGRPEGGY